MRRKEAKAKGLKTYNTGVPCKYGHMSDRRVSNCRCITCDEVYRKDNKERLKEYHREYNDNYWSGYYNNNKDLLLNNSRKWYKENKNWFREHYKNNKDKHRKS